LVFVFGITLSAPLSFVWFRMAPDIAAIEMNFEAVY